MLPSTAPESLQGHLAKVWRQLKAIDDEELVCRISYQIKNPKHPDFLLIYQDRAAFLLAVSSVNDQDIEAYLQNDFLTEEDEVEHILKGADSLELFTNDVLQQLGASGEVPIQHWILFPNASDQAVGRLERAWQGLPRYFIGKKGCRSESLHSIITAERNVELSEKILNLIVGQFAPEAGIPTGWVTQGGNTKGTDEGGQQIDFFLDYNQEEAVKRDLELSAEAFKAASAGKLRLVTGTAGCGKTLILLFRARLSASLYDNQKVLVLMHNKPLRSDLYNRAKEIGLSGNIEWRTFYSWINSMMNFDMISNHERNTFIKNEIGIADLTKQFSRHPLEFLLDEFEWISDNGPEPISLNWYLESSRTGRKRPLQERQRRQVYSIYVKYRKMLIEKKKDDWPVAPRTLLDKVHRGELNLKEYHTIYVDEAQFFAPVWFKCVREALDEKYGQLFMVADPTQGFLRSGQSWAQTLGGDMRGRSQRLEKPYRNTREIMLFARDFYQSRAITEEDEVNLPSDDSIKHMPSHSVPDFIKADKQPVPDVIIEQIQKLVDQGKNLGDILFIDASGFSEKTQLDLLQKHFPNKIVSAALARDRTKMRVTSIGACTGIESPIVILVGLDRLLEAEESLALDEIEREELIKQNTKKVFVAITRAAQRLIIIYRNERTRKKFPELEACAPEQLNQGVSVESDTPEDENELSLAERERIKINRENGRPDRCGMRFSKNEKHEIVTKYRSGVVISRIAEEYRRSAYSIAIQLEKVELITKEECKSFK